MHKYCYCQGCSSRTCLHRITMQAGAGGTSLAIAVFLHQILKNKGWKSKFGFGGSTKYMVKMLEEGQMGYILDAQVFDLDAVKSVENNPNHIPYSVFNAYNLSLIHI